MKIVYSREYLKRYKKLDERSRKAVDHALTVFMENPFAPELRNHPLKGEFMGSRSIDAGFDLRIVFSEEGNYFLVALLKVGSHSQLYR